MTLLLPTSMVARCLLVLAGLILETILVCPAVASPLMAPNATPTEPGMTTTSEPACAAGDQSCCHSDADCDDGDACTLDTCVPVKGCAHDPVGVDGVRRSVESALAVDACAAEPLPRLVTGLLNRAHTMLERAATRPSESQAPFVQSAVQRLKQGARKAALAGVHGRISSACAGELGARIQAAADRATCLLSSAVAAEKPFACLSGPGPLIRLSGMRTKGFRKRALAPGTRIDARGATFLASPSDHYPISLGGGGGVCVAGGAIRGKYDRKLDWATMHDMNNAGVAFASPTTVDGIRIDDVTDGIRPRGTGPFTIREVHLSYMRDDCVEDDHVEGGLIEDSLFDGCYVAISERPSPSIDRDGRNDLVTIRSSLLRLEPMPGPRNGSTSELGNGEFFKWSDRATKLALYDNVFMAEKVSQAGADKMGIPGTLAGCANNVMVWLGPGEYPAPLPRCFTLTNDRSVWDNAVADWLHRHPHVAP